MENEKVWIFKIDLINNILYTKSYFDDDSSRLEKFTTPEYKYRSLNSSIWEKSENFWSNEEYIDYLSNLAFLKDIRDSGTLENFEF